jgi:hypothetical protein
LAAVPRCELRFEILPQVRETRRCSEETLIGRFAIKAIVKAVNILDRPRRQFLKINLVEQGNLNRVENATHGFHFAPPRRANAAYFAEMKFDRRPGFPRRRPLIVRLGLGARGKVIAASRDDGEPRPSLSAARTVALYRSLGDVDFGFEANSAAVAAAGVNFQGHAGAFFNRRNGFDDSCPPITFAERCKIRVTCFSSPMCSQERAPAYAPSTATEPAASRTQELLM